MANNALITSPTGAGTHGVDTGVGTPFGTVDSGSLLPVGTATHWALLAASDGTVQLKFDATLVAGNVVQLVVVDTELNEVDATFSTVGGVSTWTWATGSASLYNALGTGDSANVSVTVTVFPSLVLDATVVGATDVLLSWTPSDLGSLTVESYDVYRKIASGSYAFLVNTDPDVTSYADQIDLPSTNLTYQVHMHLSDSSTILSNEEPVTTGDATAEFNCNCEVVSSYSTLAQLRQRMAIQCGYAATASNLPAGQTAEFNEYLLSAQNQLYLKFRAQRTERFFRWTMTPGLRYYGLSAAEGSCTLQLNPLAISWVGFEDLNKAWYRLVEGIDPVYYTRANINFGWPTRYEIRSCIEIFPAPQAAYTLWIKGDIGLAPFTADSDRPTFDDEAVLLFAIANWKSAKGRSDWERAMNQATARTQDLTARKHGTYRYVPSTYVQNPATPPRFLPLGSQQA